MDFFLSEKVWNISPTSWFLNVTPHIKCSNEGNKWKSVDAKSGGRTSHPNNLALFRDCDPTLLY